MNECVSIAKRDIVAKQRLSYALVLITAVVALLAGKHARDQHAEVVAAEAAQAEAESKRDDALRKAALMVESSPWALIVCNENGIIENVNPAAEKMLGWTHSEMVGKNSEFLIVPPAFRATHERSVSAAAERLREYAGDWLLTSNRRKVTALTKDGHEIDAIVTVRAIKFGGKIEFILSMSPATPPSGEPLKLDEPERISDVVQGILDKNPALSSVLNQSLGGTEGEPSQGSERKD